MYKQNPEAKFVKILKGMVYYIATIVDDSRSIPESINISFGVPVLDMGDAEFSSIMEAKYLIRWIL